MSRYIFLYPIFDRKTLTPEESRNSAHYSHIRPQQILYITYNFSVVEDVLISNLRPELYVFCRQGFTETFNNIIQMMISTGAMSNVSLIIRVTGAEYDVTTNAGPLSFMSTYRIDDNIMSSVLYIFRPIRAANLPKFTINCVMCRLHYQ